jgi:hypothetical protein
MILFFVALPPGFPLEALISARQSYAAPDGIAYSS